MSDIGDEQARLFVAVWPPPPVVSALEALERLAVDGVRWTTAEQWHVTLRFLGSCPVPPALAALAGVGATGCVAEVGGAPIRLGREALALPVSGLDHLAAAVRSAFVSVGHASERRPFLGHLTLARGRGVRSVAMAALEPLAWRVDRLDLVRSHLSRGGARYETVASADLTQP